MGNSGKSGRLFHVISDGLQPIGAWRIAQSIPLSLTQFATKVSTRYAHEFGIKCGCSMVLLHRQRCPQYTSSTLFKLFALEHGAKDMKETQSIDVRETMRDTNLNSIALLLRRCKMMLLGCPMIIP